MARRRLPRLPDVVERKLYKTGQNRGATPAEVYQNRVARNSTVLIPYSHWRECMISGGEGYENGFIVLISPQTYFDEETALDVDGLVIGENMLVFYTQRTEWTRWPPYNRDWGAAVSRIAPLGGEFVARIPGTTAAGVPPVREGFTTTAMRGAGIRVYEYASAAVTQQCRLQLEALLWMCEDSRSVFEGAGISAADVSERSSWALDGARDADLLDLGTLRANRAIDANGTTVCPLCLKRMSAQAFSDRIQQAEGRERLDTTITEASLFHIRELRVGGLGHIPYNVGWGHHHCNVVAKDAGVPATLEWMQAVVDRNAAPGTA